MSPHETDLVNTDDVDLSVRVSDVKGHVVARWTDNARDWIGGYPTREKR